MIKQLFVGAALWGATLQAQAASLFVETESFANKGGWVVDQQFMDNMGSPYLLAHGLGKPVADATTSITIPEDGTYHLFVRTYNWTSPWFKSEGPGAFKVKVNNTLLPRKVGSRGNRWEWQSAGAIALSKGTIPIALHDLRGFDGRCDALYLTTDPKQLPPTNVSALADFRRKALKLLPPQKASFDLVVVGGGVAGMSAATSAARLGMNVALIHDRPVLGGNNSSEVRVHLGGRIDLKPYPELGSLQKEFGPLKGGNAQAKNFYEDEKKETFIRSEKNITYYPSYHAFAVTMKGRGIASVKARNIESNCEIELSAPLFADCTGDGTIGFLAGADYHVGREARSEYNEPTAPDQADKQVMGASVQWYSRPTGQPCAFPIFNYGLKFNSQSTQHVDMGEWTWETGMLFDQINQAEYIRDYGLLVVFSNWSFLKNRSNDQKFSDRQLEWVAYIAGKRESRRLLGDLVLTENDLKSHKLYPDASGTTSWTIDLHYPDPENTKHFPGQEFKSICRMDKIHYYPIPYRCLYSRNVDNLFMAGRNISVTHTALGTIRVMRTTGILGEVVGMAASVCKKEKVSPRGIYPQHFEQMKTLMQQGVSTQGAPNNQRYNEGETKGYKK